jgi:hypothetical protein
MNEQTMPATRPVILLANVGNRNVSYELAGQEIALPDLFQREGSRFDFRARTRQLVEDWAAKPLDINSPFSIQIFADHLSTDVAAVHLFVTDQQTADFPDGHSQDTLYAGELCRRVLAEQCSLPTELHYYRGDPTDEDAIYTYLAPALRTLLARYPNGEYEVKFVDAGGTPGMKTVAKGLLRYYRPDVQVVYSPQAGRARPVAHAQHDRYVLLHVARQFVEKHQYRAAHDVLMNIAATCRPSRQLLTMLRTAALRKLFNREDACKAAGQQPLPEVFAQYLHQPALVPDSAVDFPEDFKDYQRQAIFELASLCQLYLNQGQYELGIPAYYRLYEELGQSFFKAKGLEPRGEEQKRKFVQDTQAQFNSRFPQVTLFVPAYRLAYIILNGSTRLQQLATEFEPTISRLNGTPSLGQREKGLNVLRNNCFLAHDNKPITRQMIEDTVPDFLLGGGRAARIFHLLGLPARNVYDQMKEEILAVFDQE